MNELTFYDCIYRVQSQNFMFRAIKHAWCKTNFIRHAQIKKWQRQPAESSFDSALSFSRISATALKCCRIRSAQRGASRSLIAM